MAKAYCKTLIEDDEHIFIDRGKSAYKGKHLQEGGELKRFYDLVKAKVIPEGSTLLVESLDRLSRQGMWEGFDSLRELTKEGITVITLEDGQPFKGELGLAATLMALMRSDANHAQSEFKANRIRESYPKRYREAREGKRVKVLLPSWLKWVAYDRPYAIKEAEAKVVQSIFEKAAKGYSYSQIARELNEAGTKPFRSGRKKTDRQGDPIWMTRSVLALVKSRSPLGEYQPNDGGAPIPDYFPAVVTLDIFNAAQGRRAERKRDGVTRVSKHHNVWGKVGICATCKRLMHMHQKGRNNEHYLVCSGKTAGLCDALNIPAKGAEPAFLEVLLNVVKADQFLSDQSNERSEILALEGQIDAAEMRRQQLARALDDDEGGDVPELTASIKKIRAKLDRLKKEKEEKEQAIQERSSIERSRAAILAKFDLDDNDSRLRANSLLRTLGIVVAITRSGSRVDYFVYQGTDRQKVLRVFDMCDGSPPRSIPYTEETAMRAFELGDTPWPEMAIDRRWGRGKPRSQETAEPVPNWGQYEEPLSEHDYEDEYTPQAEE